MTPEYIEELANIADPDQLWRLPAMEQLHLPPAKRKQLDTGVALRRYANHERHLLALLGERRSLLITPIRDNFTAVRDVESPPDHEEMRKWRL